MRLAIIVLSLVTVLAILGGGIYALDRNSRESEVSASLSLSDALNPGGLGFKSVTAPREFAFPDDHGPHPDYALEWWYFTGNLDTPEGRHFGYELTFFRVGLTSEEFDRSSEWAAQQMYTAHFALTDVENDRFHSFERYGRDALGLAGAVGSPFRVWLEDWSAASTDNDALPMRLHAGEEGIEIDLTLNGAKGIVLNGDGGFSRKGNNPGEASYYYSLTRLPTGGTITLNGETHTVTGLSWLDREWSSSQLSDEHVGWDWFALQLSDGRDIMYGVLRPAADNGSPFELGTVVEADGGYKPIQPGDVLLDVLDQLAKSARRHIPLALAFPAACGRLGHRNYALHQRPGTRRHRPLLGRRGANRRHIARRTRQRQRICRADRIRRLALVQKLHRCVRVQQRVYLELRRNHLRPLRQQAVKLLIRFDIEQRHRSPARARVEGARKPSVQLVLRPRPVFLPGLTHFRRARRMRAANREK